MMSVHESMYICVIPRRSSMYLEVTGQEGDWTDYPSLGMDVWNMEVALLLLLLPLPRYLS